MMANTFEAHVYLNALKSKIQHNTRSQDQFFIFRVLVELLQTREWKTHAF